jgi:hypothetical protein
LNLASGWLVRFRDLLGFLVVDEVSRGVRVLLGWWVVLLGWWVVVSRHRSGLPTRPPATHTATHIAGVAMFGNRRAGYAR